MSSVGVVPMPMAGVLSLLSVMPKDSIFTFVYFDVHRSDYALYSISSSCVCDKRRVIKASPNLSRLCQHHF